MSDALPSAGRRAHRVKLAFGALAVLCVNLGIGLFAREQQKSILAYTINVYDTAVISATYIHEARLQFQRFMDQRSQATGLAQIEAANALLATVIDDLEVVIERADSEWTRRLGTEARAQVVDLSQNLATGEPLRDKVLDLQGLIDNLGERASAVILGARDEIDGFSTRSDMLLLVSILSSVLLAGLSLYLLRQVVAASTLAHLTHMASHDTLTGLPNRLLLHGRMAEALKKIRRGDDAFAVLSLDLDRFKSVNDTLGHVVGDLLLKDVARRIAGCLAPDDVVTRFGGDEYVVMLSMRPTVDDAIKRAEQVSGRIVAALSEPFEISQHKITVGASIGVAMAPTDGEMVEDLLRASDLALYQAKSQGKGCYRFFTADLNALMQARRMMEIDLRDAVENEKLTVYFQPLIDVAIGEIMSCEALVRWIHPTRGFVPPVEFIPLAEEIGIIGRLGEFVLRTACREAAGWNSRVGVAVNLSAAQFTGEGLPLLVAAVLGETGLSASRLELEITESILIEDKSTVTRKLNQLRALGVRIALDDFGTGYSSLSYLSSFPFDKIKIDRSFVQNVTTRPDAAAIIRAILSLAATLNMKTTAEGIETLEELGWLREQGCHQAQGYLFSRPVPAMEFCALLTRGPFAPRAQAA